jgi:hemolysin activation/secretion protein
LSGARSRNERFPGSRAIAVLAFLGLPALAAAAAPPTLPPGAQPGGVQPRDLEKRLEPKAPAQPRFDIPPVYQRPLGTEEGPRVFVREFRIEGVREDRKAGVSPEAIRRRAEQRLAELKTLVEKLRKEKENLTEVGEDGFTPEERKEIVAFMQGAVSKLSPTRQIREYEKFINKLRLNRLEREQGLTIGQLQQVADAVTRYYRERGYFLARAVIPAQEVKDGVVTIRVLEGRLGKVIPQGNKRYSDQTLEAPFANLEGQLITVPGVENALLTVTGYPGVNAFGVFRPGEKVGTSDIVLNVQKETPWDASVRADNHGTDFTGKNRLIADFDWNNPSGGGDQLSATVLGAFSPQNALYGSLRYQHPVIDPSYSLGADLSHNSFAVQAPGFGSTDVGGVSDIVQIFLRKSFERTRQRNISAQIDFSRKRAETLFSNTVTARDDLAVIGVQFNFDYLDSESSSLASGEVRLDHGIAGILGVPTENDLRDPAYRPAPSRLPSNGEVAGSNFNKLTLRYSRLKTLTPSQTLLLRFSGQYSPDLLTSLEQFSIGGADNVRALPTSAFLTDSGAFASLEWSVKAPFFADAHAFGNYAWGDVLRFRVFTDHAVGITNGETFGSPSRITAGGNGIGFTFEIPGSWRANLDFARLNGGARPGVGPNDPNAISDSTQYWLDVTYNF